MIKEKSERIKLTYRDGSSEELNLENVAIPHAEGYYSVNQEIKGIGASLASLGERIQKKEPICLSYGVVIRETEHYKVYRLEKIINTEDIRSIERIKKSN